MILDRKLWPGVGRSTWVESAGCLCFLLHYIYLWFYIITIIYIYVFLPLSICIICIIYGLHFLYFLLDPIFLKLFFFSLEPKCCWKQSLSLSKIAVRTTYILPSPKPTLVGLHWVVIVICPTRTLYAYSQNSYTCTFVTYNSTEFWRKGYMG